ncbi:MAG: hypothetical protein QM811_30755 [Pirellulales bacterium]
MLFGPPRPRSTFTRSLALLSKRARFPPALTSALPPTDALAFGATVIGLRAGVFGSVLFGVALRTAAAALPAALPVTDGTLPPTAGVALCGRALRMVRWERRSAR